MRDVAELVALSPSHAQRVFARAVGESPKHYELRLRLEAAAILLVTTDEPIIDVALRTGFSGPDPFTRAFRRRFSLLPSTYRRASGPRPSSAGATWIAWSVGPCISLFRRPLSAAETDRSHPSGGDVPYHIDKTDLTETPILVIRRRVDLAEVGDQLATMIPPVFGFVMERNLPMAGPPVVRIVDQSPAFVTLEAGIPLAEAVEPPADDEQGIVASSLPGGPAATTIHRGPYDDLPQAHAAIDRWLAETGNRAGGSPWEVYLTDPGEVPDPADWETQVVWPLDG